MDVVFATDPFVLFGEGAGGPDPDYVRVAGQFVGPEVRPHRQLPPGPGGAVFIRRAPDEPPERLRVVGDHGFEQGFGPVPVPE